jgi:hypothetical protein
LGLNTAAARDFNLDFYFAAAYTLDYFSGQSQNFLKRAGRALGSSRPTLAIPKFASALLHFRPARESVVKL